MKITFEEGVDRTLRQASICEADYIGAGDIIHAFAKLLTLIRFSRENIYDGLWHAAEMFAGDLHEIDSGERDKIDED